jgi:hypothetical protein
MEISSRAQAPSSFDIPYKPSWNPLRCTGTGLPTNLVVLVKALAIAVLVTNHVRLLPDPWLSFIPAIDSIPGPPFKLTIQVIFVASAVAILFNRRIQWASLILGTTMLLAVVSSKAYYGNNKAFCGLMFLLTGLYKPGGLPFVRWQLALTYFGAGLNKLLDHDWQTGIFFEFWAVQRLHERAYMLLDSLLPKMWLGKFMCWFTISTELGVVPLLLIRRLYPWGALLNVLFQCGLCLFVGDTFTLFFYAMNAASLAFVTWPSKRMRVEYEASNQKMERLRRLLGRLDLDGRLEWTGASRTFAVEGALPLRLTTDDRSYTGANALRMMVLFNPVTCFVFTTLMAISGYQETSGLAIYRRVLLGITLLLLMPPLAWIVDRISRGRDTSERRASSPKIISSDTTSSIRKMHSGR